MMNMHGQMDERSILMADAILCGPERLHEYVRKQVKNPSKPEPFCAECLQKSMELSRQRDDFARMLAAIIESVGGEVRVSDRSIAFFGGPSVPTIETFEDKDNRRTVMRVVKD